MRETTHTVADVPTSARCGDASALSTRPVGANLTWEQYCSQVGVDPHAARAATTTSALALALRRLDAALRPPKVPRFDTEPGEPAPKSGR